MSGTATKYKMGMVCEEFTGREFHSLMQDIVSNANDLHDFFLAYCGNGQFNVEKLRHLEIVTVLVNRLPEDLDVKLCSHILNVTLPALDRIISDSVDIIQARDSFFRRVGDNQNLNWAVFLLSIYSSEVTSVHIDGMLRNVLSFEAFSDIFNRSIQANEKFDVSFPEDFEEQIYRVFRMTSIIGRITGSDSDLVAGIDHVGIACVVAGGTSTCANELIWRFCREIVTAMADEYHKTTELQEETSCENIETNFSVQPSFGDVCTPSPRRNAGQTEDAGGEAFKLNLYQTEKTSPWFHVLETPRSPFAPFNQLPYFDLLNEFHSAHEFRFDDCT
jgi:hypothetical protein